MLLQGMTEERWSLHQISGRWEWGWRRARRQRGRVRSEVRLHGRGVGQRRLLLLHHIHSIRISVVIIVKASIVGLIVEVLILIHGVVVVGIISSGLGRRRLERPQTRGTVLSVVVVVWMRHLRGGKMVGHYYALCGWAERPWWSRNHCFFVQQKLTLRGTAVCGNKIEETVKWRDLIFRNTICRLEQQQRQLLNWTMKHTKWRHYMRFLPEWKSECCFAAVGFLDCCMQIAATAETASTLQ